jgi:hypothetical protein
MNKRDKFSKKHFLLFLFMGCSVVFFSIALDVSASENAITPSVSDTLTVDFHIKGPDLLKADLLSIYVDLVNYSGGAAIPNTDMTLAKYHIYTGAIGSPLHVADGVLIWDIDNLIWKKENINLAWTGQGKFFVSLEFKTEAMAQSYETDLKDQQYESSYERYNTIEVIIIAGAIIGAIIGAVIIIFVIRSKKQGVSIERKSKAPKRDIKITQISKDELKKGVKGKELKDRKEKGKTEIKEDLIFSVPQWEVDEDED